MNMDERDEGDIIEHCRAGLVTSPRPEGSEWLALMSTFSIAAVMKCFRHGDAFGDMVAIII